MNTHAHQSWKRTGRGRRGVAPVELVMCLPFFALALMLIFTVSVAFMTGIEVSLAARYKAWTGRDAPWEPNPQCQEQALAVETKSLGAILGPNPVLPADRGELAAKAEAPILCFAKPLEGKLPNICCNHFVLSGVWDYNQIPFENNAKKIPPLHIDVLYRFIPGEFPMKNLSSFDSLMDFSSGRFGSPAKLLKAFQKEFSNALGALCRVSFPSVDPSDLDMARKVKESMDAYEDAKDLVRKLKTQLQGGQE